MEINDTQNSVTYICFVICGIISPLNFKLKIDFSRLPIIPQLPECDPPPPISPKQIPSLSLSLPLSAHAHQPWNIQTMYTAAECELSVFNLITTISQRKLTWTLTKLMSREYRIDDHMFCLCLFWKKSRGPNSKTVSFSDFPMD